MKAIALLKVDCTRQREMVSKSERHSACVSGGDGWRGREAARTAKVVTLETFHASRGWLKALAPSKELCTQQREMVSKSEAKRVRVRRGWVERMRGGAYG